MAAKIRPILTFCYEVEFFPEDWSDLELLTRLQLSEEVRTRLLECIQEYVREADALRQAVLASKIKPAFKKIGDACNRAANELTKTLDLIGADEWEEFLTVMNAAALLNETILNNDQPPTEMQKIIDSTNTTTPKTISEETDPYHIAREIIESEYSSRFGSELDLYNTIESLKNIASLCEMSAQEEKLESFEISDGHINILLNRLAEIFSGLGKKGPTSEECLKFIHAICAKANKYLEQMYSGTAMFNKLNDVISASSQDKNGKISNECKDRVTSRIESGRVLRATRPDS